MILISFFCVLLFLLNPVLIYVFRRLEINLQKYQFWMMVSTGIAWIGSLVVFVLKPAQTLNLTWDVGSPLLPTTVFTLDNISSTLILAICSLLFFAALNQEYSPHQLAWLSGLGGICSLGLMADSPYTLLLLISLIEIIQVVNFITSKDRSESTRRKMLAIIARLLIPYLVLFATLGSENQSPIGTFSSLSSQAGLALVAAGYAGTLGWIGFFKQKKKDSPELIPRIYSEILPGSIGLMLMIRGGMLIVVENIGSIYLLIPAIIALAAAIIGILIRERAKAWIISVLGLISGAAILGEPQIVMAWSLVLLLPGFLVRIQNSNSRGSNLGLILCSLGIITLPFLPAWTGVNIFGVGIPGYLYATAYGLAGGGILSGIFWKSVKNKFPSQTVSLPFILGSSILISVQFIIAVSSTLVSDSLRLGVHPISAWIPGLLMVILVLFGNRLPENSLPVLEKMPDSMELTFKDVFSGATGIIDQIILVLTGLFEGDGGLIWALLIAFLIISLISPGGG